MTATPAPPPGGSADAASATPAELQAAVDRALAARQLPEALRLQLRLVAVIDTERGVADPSLIPLLERLSLLLQMSGQLEAALSAQRRSLALRERSAEPQDVALAQALNETAELLRKLGRLPEALQLQRASLAVLEQVPGRESDLAIGLNNVGLVLHAMGRSAEALQSFRRSLEIRERIGGPESIDVANSLNSLAEYYRAVGPQAEAVPLYERSRAIVERQWGSEHPIVALLLANQAALDADLGRYDRALPRAERALAIRQKVLGPAHEDTAMSLLILGEIHRGLGQAERTRELLQRSLDMFEATLGPDHPHVAMASNNLGGLHENAGRYPEALPYYERSLRIMERTLGPDHRDLASPLNNLGTLYMETGRLAESLAAHRRALAIRDASLEPTHHFIALGLHNVALLEYRMGDDEAALATARRALAVGGASVGGTNVVRASQRLLSQIHGRRGQTDLAIVWGKEAVNTAQAMRAGVAGLDPRLQRGFVENFRRTYEDLADLLIVQGRLEEAQAVLQMLKEQELHEGMERAERVDPRSTRIELTGLERSRFGAYYELRDRQAALAAERQALEARSQAASLTAAEQMRLKAIVERDMLVAAQAMGVFLAQLERDMGTTTGRAEPVQRDTSRLRAAVDALATGEPGARAVGVQYLVTQDRLSIVLTLPGAPPIAHQQPVSRRQLSERIVALQLRLRSPTADPQMTRAALRELHGWLIEPIEADLHRYGARTLMLSLDDQLRLIPFAALLDVRQRHLVQDYALALYNEAARQALERPADGPWRVAAMGLSDAVEDLPALTTVPAELAGIVGGLGVSGQAWLNAQFDRPRLLSTLAPARAGAGAQRHNVLHVASHFVLQSGQPAQSRLYLGDKSRLTLADIDREDLRFGNFELVTFSACETARGGGLDATGNEMESLGAKAQNQGARAVLASLWKVNDQSTGELMQRFYAARNTGGLNKAEALRAVQLAMIDGRLSPAGGGSWTGPYHWAPFVLMGNWR